MMKRVLATYIALFLFGLTAVAQLNIETAISFGRDALGRNDYERAIRHFDEVLVVRPRLADVYYYRGYAHFSLKHYEEAMSDCDEAIKLNPFRIEYRQLRGLCHINLKNYSLAVEDYTHVLLEQPTDANALNNRALCYLHLERPDSALIDAIYLLERHPRLSSAYMLRAQVALEQHDTIDAAHWADTLLTINPRDRDALSFRGRFCLWQDDYSRADSFLTAAILAGGFTPDNYISRAQARHGLNRYNEALSDYDEAINQQPTNFIAHYNRGLLRALIGADNQALEDFDFVLALDSSNTLALYNRALLRERVGDYIGAEEDLSVIIDEFPTFYSGYAARARCRRAQGKAKLALFDETTVRRADLDLTFGHTHRTPIRRVRRLTEQDLSRYQELLEQEK